MLDATVLLVSMRIHQPVLFTWTTLVLVTVVVVVVFWACADEAPTLTNAPKRATATTEPTHWCFVFMWFVLVCVFQFLAGYAESFLASTRPKISARSSPPSHLNLVRPVHRSGFSHSSHVISSFAGSTIIHGRSCDIRRGAKT